MQSPNNDSTTNNSPSASPRRTSPPSHTNTDNNTQNSAPTEGINQLKKLSKRTLRIPKQGAKPANGSPSPSPSPSPSLSPVDASPLEGLEEAPIRDVIALGSGQGGSAAVVEATAGRTSRVRSADEARGRSKKIKLLLKCKPAEASTSPGTSTCRFCLRQFPTRTTMLDHLQMEHPTTQEQVHHQIPDHHQGEDNGGGDRKVEELEEEVSSAATEGNNNGFDLNQPMEELVQVSAAENNQVESTCGNDTIDGPRKKFRFDLNEFPSHDEDEHDENKP